jgi:DNA-binding NtrC family response regulator
MLMQPIEERKVRRLGSSGSASTRPKDVDVLLLLATNQNLSASVGHGHMRIDFLNRINAFLIEVPPLRERMEDLPELVAHLSGMLAPEWSGRFLPEATAKLLTHQWSEGNIRELRNVIERALVNNPDQDITARDLVIVTRVDRSRSQNASVEPEQHDDDFGTWQSMVKAIGAPPGLLSVDDCEAAKETLRGSFLEVVAHILEWALELTAQEGRPNLTAAARFLLGRDDVSTMEAKQFVKKLLTLDTRGKTIARRLEQSSTLMYHETLKKLMTEILK